MSFLNRFFFFFFLHTKMCSVIETPSVDYLAFLKMFYQLHHDYQDLTQNPIRLKQCSGCTVEFIIYTKSLYHLPSTKYHLLILLYMLLLSYILDLLVLALLWCTPFLVDKLQWWIELNQSLACAKTY